MLAASAVDPSSIAAVGLTGQMHGLVLLDEKGEALRPAILWNDQRAAAECDEMRRRLGLEELVRITGNDAFPGFTAPKLLWVRGHEPEVYARIAQVHQRVASVPTVKCERDSNQSARLINGQRFVVARSFHRRHAQTGHANANLRHSIYSCCQPRVELR